MDTNIKQETVGGDDTTSPEFNRNREIIAIGSSSSDFSSDDELCPKKKRRTESVLPVGFLDPILPVGFLDPISPELTVAQRSGSLNGGGDGDGFVKQEKVENANLGSKKVVAVNANPVTAVALIPRCKQFWKAGDYEGGFSGVNTYDEEMDHARVHPKFLHSNATSHKWALGAFAELLDNALDENCNGATYVHVDMLQNMKDKTNMVVVQDDGGGMTPDKMRQCMSLGYSAKSKLANTIGQYGNGFKTSTMRLGADVIVFSRCQGNYGRSSTQTIGLLSYTFLTGTGKEDIVVPMIDYERNGEMWSKHVKSSSDSWQRNLETIVEWSPYETEADLLQQFDFLSEQGTRIVIYNLWEDDLGSQELDFEIDKHDIQLRGDERNEKKIGMANMYASSRHFLTYRHSLRSYASILYRRLPDGFRIILRGKEVDHHDIVNDLMHKESHVYRPAAHPDMPSNANMSATVTLGFVKDAKHHIDIQGFNVYHKNRLIKPFWRVWNAAGSDGRGVIGVLEANFIEPAHDKQGFERTVALSRLENRLVSFQKTYWSTNCQLIGYAQRRRSKNFVSPDKNGYCSPQVEPISEKRTNNGMPNSSRDTERRSSASGIAKGYSERIDRYKSPVNFSTRQGLHPQSAEKVAANVHVKSQGSDGDEVAATPSITKMILKLREDNDKLRESSKNLTQELQSEREKCKSLQNELQDSKKMIATMDEQQEMFVSAFADERSRRQEEEENLRRRLKDASDTIQALLQKVKVLEAGKN